MEYRPDVDGLRAIAVLPVVLFHAGLAPFSGGFAGVNVFFVISGYLITSIIYPQLRDGRFSLAVFYQKRADRLFPVLFTVLAAVAVVGFVVSPPSEYKDLLASIFAAATFTSNLFFWHTQDYFSASAFTLPLLHTWSLGVEEQFYILFPLFLLLAARMRQVRALLWLALITSFLLSMLWIQRSVTGTFYLLPFRAWELLIGAAIALGAIPAIRSTIAANIAGLVGVGLLAVTYLTYSKSTVFPAHTALPPTVGAALIIMAGNHHRSLMTRWLSSSWLVVTGKASYSIYMWHWPIIVFYGLVLGYPDNPAEKWMLVALSLAAGFASWQWIEKSTRGRLSRISAWRTAGISTAMFVPLIAFAGYGFTSNGLPQRASTDVLAVAEYRDDFSAHRAHCHQDGSGLRPYQETCVLGADNAPAELVVWGDSHGVELAAALGEQLAAQGRALRQITYSACPPASGVDKPGRPFCREHNQRMLESILADTTVTQVVLAALYPSDPADFQLIADGLQLSVEALVAAGKQVIISYPLPSTTADMPLTLARRMMLGDTNRAIVPTASFLAQYEHAFRWADRMAATPGVTAVKPYELFCEDNCLMGDDKGVFFFDRHHISMYGARQIVPQYARAIETLSASTATGSTGTGGTVGTAEAN